MILSHVSVSQIKLFRECQRKWAFRYLAKIPSPPSEAQQLGTKYHAELEEYVLNDVLPPTENVRAAIPLLPEPKTNDTLVELEINLPTFKGGPKLLGFIDRYDRYPDPKVVDYKTCKTFRHTKTEEELQDDLQLLTYAYFIFREYPLEKVKVSHLYICTQKPSVREVVTEVTREMAAMKWVDTVQTVREMVTVAANYKDPLAVAPNTDECSKPWGPCEHLNSCGFLISDFGDKRMGKKPSFLNKTKTEATKDTLLESALRYAAEGSPSGKEVETSMDKAQAEVTPPEEEVVYTLLPPDSPPRTTPVEITTEVTEPPPRKRGRKAKTESASDVRHNDLSAASGQPAKADSNDPTNLSDADNPTAPRVVAAPDGFSIFIDSYPTKGYGEVTLAEDFLCPILSKLCVENSVPDIRMLPFGGWKHVLGIELRNRINEIPPILVISSKYGPYNDVLLAELIPYCKQLVRGI